MKLAHISDLHLGKISNGYSMLEEQKYILQQILHLLKARNTEVLLIAGDVYDKSIPPAEAVRLFDDFLVRLAQQKIQVFIISGNHDSGDRISFGADLMNLSGVHIAKPFTQTTREIKPVVLKDEFGPVHIYLLPFIKPSHVKNAFESEEITTYTQAVHRVIEAMRVDPAVRNILVTHQFVTGAARCDSEQTVLGGADNVDASVFEPFDYVALGHLHGPQSVGRDTLRYCGSPLKYSFSEVNHQKSVSFIELQQKGTVRLEYGELVPWHDWQELRGPYNELMSGAFASKQKKENYFRITLTDEEDIPFALEKLRTVYPNIMALSYDNKRTSENAEVGTLAERETKTPLEIFAEFYQKQNNQPLSENQTSHLQKLIETIWEEN